MLVYHDESQRVHSSYLLRLAREIVVGDDLASDTSVNIYVASSNDTNHRVLEPRWVVQFQVDLAVTAGVGS